MTEKKLVKCAICGKEFENYYSFARHITQGHEISSRDYYFKYLRKGSEGICPVCGKNTDFISMRKGFYKHCSAKCSMADSKTREKMQETCIERFGVDNAFKSAEIKEKIKQENLKKYKVDNPAKAKKVQEKIKKTNLIRYGCENALQNQEVKNKTRNTMLERYGVEHALQSKEIQNKIIKNNLKKYGCKYIGQVEEFRKKREHTCLEKYKVKHPMQLEKNKEKISAIQKAKDKKMESFGYVPLRNLIKMYGQTWYYSKEFEQYFLRRKNLVYLHCRYIPLLEEYIEEHSSGTSIFEKSVINFVKNVTKEEVIFNSRDIIQPLELDLYIPDKKIAIECDGVYYHSVNMGTNPSYHLQKTKECQEKGIRLIHITDWEWKNKKKICQSIIMSALNIFTNIIDANECAVREVSVNKTREFLNKNSILEYTSGDIRLGLYYKEELVQIIVLERKKSTKEYLLLRNCTKLNTKVKNGLPTLVDHLPKNIEEIIVNLNIDKFIADEYYNSGWVFVNYIKPDYTYYKSDKKYNKKQYTKENIEKLLGDENYNNNLSETENMLNNNYLKVYDCGKISLKYKRNS